MTPALIDVTVTCPDDACASTIARHLVEERLVACANIGPAITSLYRWKGTLEEDREVILTLKTRQDLFGVLCARIGELHPYEVAAIVAWPLALVSKDYADWVLSETLASPSDKS